MFGKENYTFFGVSGHIVVDRLKSGFRKLVYDDAVETHACHDFRLNQIANTIYYKEADDDNLYFSLLFSSIENAHAFKCKLLSRFRHPFKNMTVVFNHKNQIVVEEIEAPTAVAKLVYPDDSKKAGSTSNDNSAHGFSATELSNTYDPLRSLRSLEKLTLIPRKETIYRCHIAPKGYYKGACAIDPDNYLYGSNRFRVYFDGDGKRRPRGYSLDWGFPPELWIDYVEAVPNVTTVDGVCYHEVFVNIMFREDDVADSMRGLWKDGTEDIGDNGFRTSFFTTNAEKAKKYLEIRKHETRIRWGVKDDMVTPQHPAFEEVEVADLDESGEVDLDLDNLNLKYFTV